MRMLKFQLGARSASSVTSSRPPRPSATALTAVSSVTTEFLGYFKQTAVNINIPGWGLICQLGIVLKTVQVNLYLMELGYIVPGRKRVLARVYLGLPWLAVTLLTT